jgi:protein TonB
MNSLSLKHKSFFYSLTIHLVLVLIALAVYMKKNENHEVYSLVNLKSLEICTPDIAKPVEQKQTRPVRKHFVEKEMKKPIAKPVVKVTEPLVPPLMTKKRVPVVSERVKEVAVIEPEVLKAKEAVEKPVEAQEEVKETTEIAAVEETAPVVAVSKPKVSYEAQYIQDNIALINALIKKNLSYPKIAKKRGLQGKAMVSFTLNLEGEVLDIEALGVLSAILKKSAIKTVKKASSDFPRPTRVLALRIPIVYKLH